jgi:hypothetical protein
MEKEKRNRRKGEPETAEKIDLQSTVQDRLKATRA